MTQPVPPLESLKSNYPTHEKSDLAREMGFAGRALEDILELWDNTCAIRVSYCLLKCGVDLGTEPGRGTETQIPAGSLKGKHYWMSQKNLSNHLKKTVFGAPQYTGLIKNELINKIGGSGGIISYFSLDGYPGGHIDVVYYDHDIFTGMFGDRYDLKVEDVEGSSWNLFNIYTDQAKEEIRFWNVTGQEAAQRVLRRAGSRLRGHH